MSLSLFIVQSPLQLLNAIEASYALGKNGHYIVIYRNKNNLSRMRKLAELYSLNDVDYISAGLFSHFFVNFRTRMRYREIVGKVDTIIYGSLAMWAINLITYLKPKTLYMVDDGQQTVNLLVNPEATRLAKRSGKKLSHILSNSIFFTYYTDIAALSNVRHIPNTLEHVKTGLTQNPATPNIPPLDNNDILFIGANIFDKYNDFTGTLEKIVKHAESKRKKIFYVMHRFDCEETINILADKHNFTAVKYDYPLELIFSLLWSKNQPEVWGVGSTAIDTVLLMFPDAKVQIFSLDSTRFYKIKDRLAFSSLLSMYRTNASVDVIDLY